MCHLLEPPIRSPLRTDVHVFSDSVLSVGGHNAIADEAWAAKTSEVWDPMTLKDKYDITGRPVQFHGHIFLATQRSRSTMRTKDSWDPQNRMSSVLESYSRRCSTTLNGGPKTLSKHVLQM